MTRGEDAQEFGRAVEARRGELGMTRQELADAAGVDLKTVYNLESAGRRPIARVRAAISAALGWKEDAPTAADDIDVMQVIPVPAELRDAARPYAVKYHRLYVEAVARTGSTDPAGDEVFEPGSWAAQSWDLFRRQFPDTLRRLGIIAGASVPDDRAPGRHGAAAGLTEAALDRSGGA